MFIVGVNREDVSMVKKYIRIMLHGVYRIFAYIRVHSAVSLYMTYRVHFSKEFASGSPDLSGGHTEVIVS